jgi:DNA-directed RNA polymerase sigma subunit (sigma70/sigma32)
MKSGLNSNDPLSFYLRELDTIQPLTEDEESELLQHVRSQDEQSEFASRRLIEAKLSLVVLIAERYSSADTNVLDLVEKGNEGLLIALTTLGDRSGKSFTAHATDCIEDAIAKATTESKAPSE